MTVTPIREEQRYGGQRVRLRAELHGARISLQFDIGFGDAVTPAAEWVEVPVVLAGSDRPQLKAYPVYTMIAEKFEAMVQLGMANSRMKDFYDLDFLLSRFSWTTRFCGRRSGTRLCDGRQLCQLEESPCSRRSL